MAAWTFPRSSSTIWQRAPLQDAAACPDDEHATRAADVVAADWKAGGNDYVVVGRVSARAMPAHRGLRSGQCAHGQTMATQRFAGPQAALRNAAHRVSDVIYEKIIGVRGAFATRIAYVSVDGRRPRKTTSSSLPTRTARTSARCWSRAIRSCRPHGRRTGSGWRTCRSNPVALRFMCSRCAAVSDLVFRRAPASMGPGVFARLASDSPSRWRHRR